MKKVCFVTTIPTTMYAFVLDTAIYLHANAEVEIVLVCDRDEHFAEVVPEYMRYMPVPMKRGVDPWGFVAVFRLWRLFRQERFDLVQYSTPNAAFYASIAARMAQVPLRLYAQMGVIYVSLSGLSRAVFRLVEAVTCALSNRIEAVSHSNLLFCQAAGLYTAEKSTVIWNGSSSGVDLERFDILMKSEWRQRTRRALHLPSEAVLFGFVGRITRDKGVNELLEAFRSLLVIHPESYLLLLGDLEDVDSLDAGDYHWALREPHVVLQGFVHNVEEFFAAMDAFVLPSYREGFGNVVIEAEAMGVPVIVSEIPGPIDAIIPNETGLLVQKASVGALLEAMTELAENECARDAMGRAGHVFVERNFDHRVLMSRVLAERKKLLGLP